MLEELRKALRRRGAEGMRTITRSFKLADSNKDGSVELAEFLVLAERCRLGLSDAEAASLHGHFDKDGSGKIDSEEFLDAVRGPMPTVRRKLVIEAFNALDALGKKDGVLTVDDLAPHYNTERHPDVIGGKKTRGEVLRAFLDNFDGGVNNARDGTVSSEEWLAYYQHISNGIDCDDFFGDMVLRSWPELKLSYTPRAELDALEKLIRSTVWQKGSLKQGSSGGARGDDFQPLRAAFSRSDADGSGTLGFDEFTKAMELFGFVKDAKSPLSGKLLGVALRALFDRCEPPPPPLRPPPPRPPSPHPLPHHPFYPTHPHYPFYPTHTPTTPSTPPTPPLPLTIDMMSMALECFR